MVGGIEVVVEEDAAAVARRAAATVAELLRRRPDAVLGLATGATPEGTYAELLRLHREQGLSWARARTFNLDEYWGLSGDHPQSYRRFMQERLFDQLDVRPWNTHVLDGAARSPHRECRAFEQKILAAGGVDLWLLGIGPNGHIAFNEPGSSLDSRTRLVALAPETIAVSSGHFAGEEHVPRCALTVGVGTIFEARSLLLLALGEHKAPAVQAALEGACTSACPASFLQSHGDCTFLLDRAAASRLSG